MSRLLWVAACLLAVSCSASASLQRSPDRPARALCPQGTYRWGDRCMAIEAPFHLCDAGERWDGKECKPTCPPQTAFQEGVGCNKSSRVAKSKTPAPIASGSTRRRTVRIVDAGQVFSTINQTDCVSWPSEQMKKAAGINAWNPDGYYPRDGEVGTVVFETHHCDQSMTILVLQIGKHLVPIGEDGVSE